MALIESLVCLLLLMVLLIIICILACKPRRLFSHFSYCNRTITDDLHKPFLSSNPILDQSHSNELNASLVESSHQNRSHLILFNNSGAVCRDQYLSAGHASEADSLILDVISDSSKEGATDRTCKRPVQEYWPIDEEQNNINMDQSLSNEMASCLVEPSSQSGSHLTFLDLNNNGGVCQDHNMPSGEANEAVSLVLDVITESSEEIVANRTHKRPALADWLIDEEQKYEKKEPKYDLPFDIGDDRSDLSVTVAEDRGSCLTLEVISGPSCGLHLSLVSSSMSQLPATIGRVSSCDLLLKDAEVSGKHALINWNLNRVKWELTDMGSLNGTHLNTQAVHHADLGHRYWGSPVELANGDIITLGTTSKVLVHITPQASHKIPFGVGLASDPMTLRHGKRLPMEDVSYSQWPLPEVKQFGLFGIFDGHGGSGAAKTASKTLPKVVANILSVSDKRESIISGCDASEILRDAFIQTEAAMTHQYEGCTATVLLVWAHEHENFFAQCANVGDSACIVSIGDSHLTLTEDHRVASPSEKARLRSAGPPIGDGETRLYGMNIARMLGDKFLKENESRFSSVPYISQSVHIPKGTKSFALMASDGLWDVISTREAVKLVLQAREKCGSDLPNLAKKVANLILNEAKTLHTKDNTSVIFLDFDSTRICHCN